MWVQLPLALPSPYRLTVGQVFCNHQAGVRFLVGAPHYDIRADSALSQSSTTRLGTILSGFFVMQVPDAMNEVIKPHRAPARSTEGSRPVRAGSQGARGGRPKGSKNRPKGILPTELANTILLQLKDTLPPEHFEYMRGVIREGKSISTKTELDTLILILNRNLLPALVIEGMGVGEPVDEADDEDFFADEDVTSADTAVRKAMEPKLKMPVFRKDVTERLKVLQGLLSLRNQVEKRDADLQTEEKSIIRVVGQRGLDSDRLRILIGVESGSLVERVDGVGHQADSPRAVPDQVPERPLVLSASE